MWRFDVHFRKDEWVGKTVIINYNIININNFGQTEIAMTSEYIPAKI